MKRATSIPLILVGLLAAGCQVKQAKPVPSLPTATAIVPTVEGPAAASKTSTATSEITNPDAAPAALSLAEGTDDAFSRSVPAASPPNSRLQIITWDFGTIAPGTKTHHQFAITNHDSRAWTIRNVSRTCACTVGEFTPTVLKPAATGLLNVDFRAGAKQALVAKTIVVEFKEPRTPVFQLVIQGEVSDALSAVPAAVKFGRVPAGAETAPTRSLEVRNSSRQDVTITKVESPEWLRVEYQRVETRPRPHAPRQTWSLLVRAEPGRLKPGLHTATVIIHTDGEGLEPLKIPVGLYQNGPIEPIPGHLTFAPVASGKITQKNFLLEIAPDLQGITAEDLEFTHDFGEELEVPTPRQVAGNRFLVTARFRPRRSPGKVKGELVIRAKGRDVAPAHVKIFGEVR